MSLLVHKYGGTSVGSLDRIQHVADRVVAAKAAGHNLVVVLSAMHGETDRLIEMAKQIHPVPDPHAYDLLVSSGEQVSISLLAMALLSRGVKAKPLTGPQAGVRTDSQHRKARITDVDAEALKALVDAGVVPIVAGFQGMDEQGHVTTFGRGGSDTTAVALAVALQAKECQIYTDVDGVYTTDPRVVPNARRLDEVSFEEMLELSSLGAKVLQIRSVEFAGKYNVPIRVLSTFKEGPGTLITNEDMRVEQPLVSGVAFDRNQAQITLVGMLNQPGNVHRIISAISEKGIELDVIVQNMPDKDDCVDLSFTLGRDDFEVTKGIIDNLIKDNLFKEMLCNDQVAKLSVVGIGMHSHAGVATTMFAALAKEGINIHMISTSEIKISVIIDEKYLELGARVLHEAFELNPGVDK